MKEKLLKVGTTTTKDGLTQGYSIYRESFRMYRVEFSNREDGEPESEEWFLSLRKAKEYIKCL